MAARTAPPLLPSASEGAPSANDAAGVAVESIEVEPFGRAFIRRAAVSIYGEERKTMQEEDNDEEDAEFAARMAAKKKKAEFIQDHYELLGLEHLTWKANAEDIKKAYRQAVLQWHPDKNPNLPDDSMFKKVQLAHETLTNPAKRRAYDSTIDADDSLPSASAKGDFFETYRPVFERNARWSVRQPVPELGDADTPIDVVERFYEFWFKLKTWRDFTLMLEHNENEASERAEKRWMQKQNAKERERLDKKEIERLRKLVDMAYERDPRILKQKADEKEAKARAAQAKKEAQDKAREEAERAAAQRKKAEEDEAARVKAEVEAAKKHKEEQKKALKKARQRLRAESERAQVDPVVLERLCDNLALDVMAALVEAVEGKPPAEAKASIDAAHTKYQEDLVQKTRDEAAAAQQAANAKKAAQGGDAPWTMEELALLARASARFPGGTVNRWQEISNFMDGARTPDQVARKVSEMRKGTEKVAAEETRKKPERVIKVERDVRYVTPQEEAAQLAEAERTSAKKAAAAAGAGGGGGAGAGTGVQVPSEDGWTAEQQQALEAALVKFPASLGKERWDQIAEEVPGRSKKECVKRYKELVEFFKGKK